jgi:hypothetical protein
MSLHSDFLAPELVTEIWGNFQISTPKSDEIVSFPLEHDAADVWSVGMIAKFLATGKVSANLKPLA